MTARRVIAAALVSLVLGAVPAESPAADAPGHVTRGLATFVHGSSHASPGDTIALVLVA